MKRGDESQNTTVRLDCECVPLSPRAFISHVEAVFFLWKTSENNFVLVRKDGVNRINGHGKINQNMRGSNSDQQNGKKY